MKQQFIKFTIVTLLILLVIVFLYPFLWWLMVPYAFIVAVGLYDMRQTKHALWRNFPLLGRFRWVLEEMRPPIRQYFIESDIDGVPFNRTHIFYRIDQTQYRRYDELFKPLNRGDLLHKPYPKEYEHYMPSVDS